VLSEVYGFKAARRAILLGFAMNILAAVTFWVTIYLPAADFYPNQEHFENVVHAYTQLIVAGLAGFIVGQTINAWVVVRIKERTKEKHLWARLVGSTFAGQLGDTLVFCSIAAGAIGINTFADFATYTALGWVYKTGVEVVMLPITYRVIAYIKRHEPTYGQAI
jgi:queuosine precursor transporter